MWGLSPGPEAGSAGELSDWTCGFSSLNPPFINKPTGLAEMDSKPLPTFKFLWSLPASVKRTLRLPKLSLICAFTHLFKHIEYLFVPSVWNRVVDKQTCNQLVCRDKCNQWKIWGDIGACIRTWPQLGGQAWPWDKACRQRKHQIWMALSSEGYRTIQRYIKGPQKDWSVIGQGDVVSHCP